VKHIILLILLAISLCGCKHSSENNSTKDSLVTTLTVKDKFSQDATSFVVGDEINFQVVVTNKENFEVTYSVTAPGDYINIKQDNTQIWNKYYGIDFAQVIQERTIGAHESITYTSTWYGNNNQGEMVLPGEYTVEGGSILSINQEIIDQPPSIILELQ
jgi:hypothetical protein